MSTREASRRSPLHDRWALQVKERAHWKCEGCGMGVDAIRKLGGNLEAAHILPHSEYPDRRYDPENGRALCTFRNRHHPKGLGNGFGCHNAMSGHWGHAYGVMPGTRQSLVAARAHAGSHWVLGTIALFAAFGLWDAHLTLWGYGAFAACLVLWLEGFLATLTWAFLLVANAHLRHFASLRPYLIGPPPVGFGGLLGWMAVLLALWLVCLALAHVMLKRRWLGRLWGLVRRT